MFVADCVRMCVGVCGCDKGEVEEAEEAEEVESWQVIVLPIAGGGDVEKDKVSGLI